MQTPQLELHKELVQSALDSTSYVLHAKGSADEIEEVTVEGLKLTEGRATVSSNLVYSYEIARTKTNTTNVTAETDEEEPGSVIVIKLPENRKVGFATFTDIIVDEAQKQITGDPLKYVAAFKQLGIYSNTDTITRKTEIETMPVASRPILAITPQDFNMFLQASDQLNNIIADIGAQARSFSQVYFEEVSQRIKASSSTFGVNPEVLKEVVLSTIAAISVSRIRNLSLNIMRAQGYKIFNKNGEIISQIFNAENLALKLNDLKQKVQKPEFTLGIDWLDTYVKENIEMLAQEIA